MQKQKYVIIVAGGSGKRMGVEMPKQFIQVAGKPILMHTIEAFYGADSTISIILVLPENEHSYWNKLKEEYNFSIPHLVATGGKERFNSVQNGLRLVTKDGLVGVHDGVRPLVSKLTINRCYAEAEKFKAVIPVLPSTESIREGTMAESKAVDRANYFMVQTPQVFEVGLLKQAYKQANTNTFTDDASVVEALGFKITMVEGNPENIKVTRPMDLKIAEVLLKPEL